MSLSEAKNNPEIELTTDPASDPIKEPTPAPKPVEDPEPGHRGPVNDPEPGPDPEPDAPEARRAARGSTLKGTRHQHRSAAGTYLQACPRGQASQTSRAGKAEKAGRRVRAVPFSVTVGQVYEGPLDLLLDLVRKQNIDIYDIPIAKITAQFLAYVDQLKATDVDVAGEFIYTASLLIHIKSKMLLPRAPPGPDDAADDPRRELVERLLEHERFKNAAQMLQQKQMLEAATWTNPGMREFKEDAAAEPEIAADTVDLVRIFRDILERARKRPIFNVQEDSITVRQMIQFLRAG